jgi:alkylation response protein AidB-like acyl-CoA dehydrogenase
MLTAPEYGGKGSSFAQFTALLKEMSKIDSTLAGLASIHGCIGAVDPLVTFGDEQQKQRFLPDLSSGKRLSAFALTEPGAGSDLTAVKTTATLDGDHWVVNGRKLFISNIALGRTIGLVCLIKDKPAVLIVDLPKVEDETFRFENYDIYALSHLWNRGMVFNGFRVPKDNLLDPTQGGKIRGDGLTIAYHGLNRGRVALCANAAGTLSALLADVVPWAKARVTYNKAIGTRQLVQERLGEAAAYIVGCEAISSWCANLLDQGYRGELECIVAKVFGSDALREVGINDILKTFGGRSFLKGNSVGDNLHDLIAPSIYEGDNDMLLMALAKGLLGAHSKTYFGPLMDKVIELQQNGTLRGNLNINNPLHFWKVRKEAIPYGLWLVRNGVKQKAAEIFGRGVDVPPEMPSESVKHLRFAAGRLGAITQKIDGLMIRYQHKLPDQQCELRDLAGEVKNLLMIAVVSCWGAAQSEKTSAKAADLLCQDLTRKVKGSNRSARLAKALARLGQDVEDGKFSPTQGIPTSPFLQPYEGLKSGQ